MRKFPFPWIAAGIGLMAFIALFRSGAMSPTADHALPLLTLLFMSEFGFLVTAVGAAVGIRSWLAQRGNLVMLALSALCLVLAVGLFWIGWALWQNSVAV